MYDYKTEPFDHQREALKDSWSAEFHAYFMEMGTGKSKVAIDNIGVLYEKGELNAVLIVAPKGVYDNWVKGEIPLHLPDRIKRSVVRWTPSASKLSLVSSSSASATISSSSGSLLSFFQASRSA